MKKFFLAMLVFLIATPQVLADKAAAVKKQRMLCGMFSDVAARTVGYISEGLSTEAMLLREWKYYNGRISKNSLAYLMEILPSRLEAFQKEYKHYGLVYQGKVLPDRVKDQCMKHGRYLTNGMKLNILKAEYSTKQNR